jgi:hypothetical protein
VTGIARSRSFRAQENGDRRRIDGGVEDQSQKDDMRAALRGDRARALERWRSEGREPVFVAAEPLPEPEPEPEPAATVPPPEPEPVAVVEAAPPPAEREPERELAVEPEPGPEPVLTEAPSSAPTTRVGWLRRLLRRA